MLKKSPRTVSSAQSSLLGGLKSSVSRCLTMSYLGVFSYQQETIDQTIKLSTIQGLSKLYPRFSNQNPTRIQRVADSWYLATRQSVLFTFQPNISPWKPWRKDVQQAPLVRKNQPIWTRCSNWIISPVKIKTKRLKPPPRIRLRPEFLITSRLVGWIKLLSNT